MPIHTTDLSCELKATDTKAAAFISAKVKSSPFYADNRSIKFGKPLTGSLEAKMFWTGFAIGIFLGATVGMVVAGLLAARGRDYSAEHWGKTPIDQAVMDEVEESPVNVSEASRSATYLDEYPYS